MARNITITIDEMTLQAAKVAAARRGLSLSAFLRQELRRIGNEDERYDAARRSALEWMKSKANLGAGELPDRADLHDRDALR